MKRKMRWLILAAFVLAILVGILRMVLGRHVALLVVLAGAAFILSWNAPVRFWLIPLIFVAGTLIVNIIWSSLRFPLQTPLSWWGDVVLPAIIIFPVAFLGGLLGSFHHVVKDDF